MQDCGVSPSLSVRVRNMLRLSFMFYHQLHLAIDILWYKVQLIDTMPIYVIFKFRSLDMSCDQAYALRLRQQDSHSVKKIHFVLGDLTEARLPKLANFLP